MPIDASHDVQHCRGELVDMTSHCTRKGLKGHMVPRIKMTHFYTAKGAKLPICTDCLESMKARRRDS